MDLKQLAFDLSKIYSEYPKVDAVLLGGSVARSWNDKYSDIELFVLWKNKPSDEERMASIHKANGSVIDFFDYEDEEWSETYVSQGVKLEISNFLTETIERVIKEVTIQFDTNLDKQCLVATVHDGLTLFGEKVITELKDRIKEYPADLGKAMIEENLEFGSRWNNREALLFREDWLMLYKVMVDVQVNLMKILFGLNRLYVHHPAFKWQKYSIEKMKKAPVNLQERLDSILLNNPKMGILELEKIINEVFQLVQKEYPSTDLSEVIKKSLFLRPKNEIK